MTDLVVDRLRIRGPGARRLAEIAARLLSERLDRALADVGDLEVGTVTVRLDVDPERDDPEVIATLWAEAIRAEVLALGGHRTGPGRAGTGPVFAPRYVVPSAAEVAEVLLAWLEAPADAPHLLPRELVYLADPDLATSVAATLGGRAWAALTARIRALLPARPEQGGGTTAEGKPPARMLLDPATGPRPGPDGDLPNHPDTDVPDVAATVTPGHTDDPRTADASSAPPLDADLLRLLESLAELLGEDAEPVDLTRLTRAAGLVLLWPWLGDLGREAERALPHETPHVVRARAFAHLADPEQPGLVDDPLVRFLAGVPDEGDTVPVVALADPTRMSAERVLGAFAGLLPGFASSTGRFVRDEWLLRVGLLDPTTAPAQLEAATHPLDVVLPALPYPLTLFKLPWSDPLTVRFRP